MLIFGDLNFRLEVDNEQCRQMIKDGKLKELQEYDQFLVTKKTNPNFSSLEEGPLSFNPTYKFNINTNEYDTSKKYRVPAWCDRILWKSHENLKLKCYNSVDYTYSDHKPVYAIFNIKITVKKSDTSQSCKNINPKNTLNINIKNSFYLTKIR